MKKITVVLAVTLAWVGLLVWVPVVLPHVVEAPSVDDAQVSGVQQIRRSNQETQQAYTHLDEARQYIAAFNLPNQTQYTQVLDEYQDMVVKDQSVTAEQAFNQAWMTAVAAQEDATLLAKNPLFQQLDAYRVTVREYQAYFAQSDEYQAEKSIIGSLEEMAQKLVRQRYDSDFTAQQMQQIMQQEFVPGIATLEVSKNQREEEIAQQEARQQFIRQRQQQDQRNRALGIQAPSSPLPTSPKMIFVSIADQAMYSYEYGIPIQVSPVVTGKPGFDTVRGQFAVYRKEADATLNSPFEDIDYAVPVRYWMPFYSGYGIHDASWRRGAFGGDIYQTSGSYGCVNTPHVVAEWMFDWVEVGTPVVVS